MLHLLSQKKQFGFVLSAIFTSYEFFLTGRFFHYGANNLSVRYIMHPYSWHINPQVVCIRINSQRSSCHQRFYIISVDIQCFVVFIHGFHMTTMFEVVHTCTDTERHTNDMQKNLSKGQVVYFVLL